MATTAVNDKPPDFASSRSAGVKAHPTLNNQYEIRSDAKQEKREIITREFPFWNKPPRDCLCYGDVTPASQMHSCGTT